MPLTAADVLAIVRERCGLTRLDASIAALMQSPSAAPEWRYARVAIADRLRWLDYGVSHADPQQLAHAEMVLQAERAADSRAPEFTPRDWQLAWESAS